MKRERLTLPLPEGPVPQVTAALHVPDDRTAPPVLLTHGAGGDLDGEPLVALAELLAELGHLTVRCNLPYREAGRRAAPRAESSVAPFRALVDAAQDLAVARGLAGADEGWVLGGKSYGGRVASLAVAAGTTARGLLFYGYPLHPPGRPEKLRVGHWPHVFAPCLFLQGTRDTFCDLTLLEQHLRKLPRRATVELVEGGDHSLKVTRAASPDGQARSPRASLHALREPIARWIRGLD